MLRRFIKRPKPNNRVNLTLERKSNAPSKLNEKPASTLKPLISESKSAIVLPPSFKARLEIGYPPIRESYISHVSIIRPNLVKSISRDTRLFEFLINEWKFHPIASSESQTLSRTVPVKEDEMRSCIVEFYVSFKFRSPVYSRFSSLFMDQIFRKMVNAFTHRALVLYGKPAVQPKELMYSH